VGVLTLVLLFGLRPSGGISHSHSDASCVLFPLSGMFFSQPSIPVGIYQDLFFSWAAEPIPVWRLRGRLAASSMMWAAGKWRGWCRLTLTVAARLPRALHVRTLLHSGSPRRRGQPRPEQPTRLISTASVSGEHFWKLVSVRIAFNLIK